MFTLDNVKINKIPFPYFVKNNVLPHEVAEKAQHEILNIKKEKWDRYDNPFENKYTLRDKNDLPKTVNDIFNFLTSEIFLDELSKVYNIKLYNDPTKNWWGVHKYDNGDKLDIHVDAGFNLEDIIYKQTLVPFDNYGQTVIFKNKFYGYATNFTIDQKEIEEFKNQFTPGKNKRSDDHRKLYGDKDFDKKLHSQYLKHVNYDNLKGLEIELIYEWNVGDLLVFDRTHIHAASCNINKKKTGLATFTKK